MKWPATSLRHPEDPVKSPVPDGTAANKDPVKGPLPDINKDPVTNSVPDVNKDPVKSPVADGTSPRKEPVKEQAAKPREPAKAPAAGQTGPTTYWLGRKPDSSKNEYVFDVRVPAGVAAVITCSDPKYAKFRSGVKQFQWEAAGSNYTFVQNSLAWANNMIDNGQVAFERGGVSGDAWAHMSLASAEGKACKEQLKALARTQGEWKYVTPTLLKMAGSANPQLTVNFDADRPYDILRNAPTKVPQVVPVVYDNALYIAWQTWGGSGPTNKIVVSRASLNSLSQGEVTTVREVPSLGALVGFTVDATGADHVLSARAEQFPNNAEGNFVDEVHSQWRKNVVMLYSSGQGTDLNSDKFTGLTFYGLTNSGSGRLAAGANHLAAIFARRHYSTGDHLIHQEANDLLLSRDLSSVPLKAGNTVSHSFDQRLIFDGTDFVTLNQGDTYPYAGLIVEKLHTKGGPKAARIARFLAYACPTFGNAVYFELGGLAAEPDGYPVLFTATRNTAAVNDSNAGPMHDMAWDLALVYLVRDFDTKPHPKNSYDITSSGILAGGFAPDQEFTVDNFTWNSQTSRFDKPDPRIIKRRVLWLTEYDATTKATNAKFVKLADGQYVALWEEHTFADKTWRYATTRALRLPAAAVPPTSPSRGAARSS